MKVQINVKAVAASTTKMICEIEIAKKETQLENGMEIENEKVFFL
jgi:hypothetical protein